MNVASDLLLGVDGRIALAPSAEEAKTPGIVNSVLDHETSHSADRYARVSLPSVGEQGMGSPPHHRQDARFMDNMPSLLNNLNAVSSQGKISGDTGA